MKAKIIKSGSYIPKTKVSNFDLEKIMDTSNEWIVQRTGIKSRYYEDVGSVNMAYQASLDALGDIDVESIDAIIVGSYTSDQSIPSTASQVRKLLNIKRAIPAFDVNAACSGFMYILHIANSFIKSKTYKRILIVGVDYNSKTLDFSDRTTAILFGDGAGAMILQASDSGIIDSQIFGESDEDLVLTLENKDENNNPFTKKEKQGNSYLKMDGQKVFKFAVRVFDSSIRKILNENNLDISDIDYVIAHQANERILLSGIRSLKIAREKVLMNVSEYGNTSSASVPILFDEANKKGLLKPNMKVILIAFGGGLTYGCSLIEI